jgi:choline dehydrogenase-like flavoprotein
MKQSCAVALLEITHWLLERSLSQSERYERYSGAACRVQLQREQAQIWKHGGNMSRQALQAAGVTDILDSGLLTLAYHLMGTARMGTDHRKSVVKASHRAHDVPNLYLVD